MSRQTKQEPLSPEGTDALANFARVFWDAAVRDVESRIEAEENAAKQSGKDKTKVKS